MKNTSFLIVYEQMFLVIVKGKGSKLQNETDSKFILRFTKMAWADIPSYACQLICGAPLIDNYGYLRISFSHLHF